MSAVDESLEGKVAIVTGSTQGYGFSVARQLAEGGAKVALFARTESALNAAAEVIGANALPVVVDITDPDQVRAGFAKVWGTFGRLDILVNNACAVIFNKLENASDADIRNSVDVNFTGHMYSCREAIPYMRRTGGGSIANVSSESARFPFPFLAPYSASKAGLEAMCAALRYEVQDDNIRVTVFRTGARNGEGEGSPHKAPDGMPAGYDPAMMQEANEMWAKTGHSHYASGAGGPMNPDVVARSVVHTVTRTDRANIDLVEIRAL